MNEQFCNATYASRRCKSNSRGATLRFVQWERKGPGVQSRLANGTRTRFRERVVRVIIGQAARVLLSCRTRHRVRVPGHHKAGAIKPVSCFGWPARIVCHRTENGSTFARYSTRSLPRFYMPGQFGNRVDVCIRPFRNVSN